MTVGHMLLKVEPADDFVGDPYLDPVAPDFGSGGRRGAAGDMIRGSLWTLIAALTSIPVSFAVNLVVARVLAPSAYGRLATYAALIGVVTTILNLGISQATVQWISEGRLDGPIAPRLNLIRNCVGYHAFVEGPVAAVTVVFLLRNSNPWVWVVGSLAMLASCALGTSLVVLSATARNAAVAKISLGMTLALQMATLVVAVATRSAYTTYAAELVAGVLAPAIGFIVIRGEERKAFRHPLILRGLPTGFVRYGLSACGAGLVASIVFGRSELFVLQWHHLSEAAGIFALATGLAGQITVPMDSVMGPLLPTATRLLAAEPMRATETAARSIRVASVLATLTLATAIPVVYVAIPLLFGSEFGQARTPFLVLGAVSCLQSVALPLSMLVFATRNAGSVLLINLVCVAVDAALAIGLVPLVGLWGAVVANASAQSLSLGLLMIVAIRRVGIQANALGRACLPLILGFGAGVLAVALADLIQVRIGALVIAIFVGTVSLVIGYWCIPQWRVSATDSALVEGSLPSWLRSPYRWTTGTFKLVATPNKGRLEHESP
jgi:O-antigen/teichoic acid export membrane protein